VVKKISISDPLHPSVFISHSSSLSSLLYSDFLQRPAGVVVKILLVYSRKFAFIASPAGRCRPVSDRPASAFGGRGSKSLFL